MKTFSLTVAEPCHENWDAMTPDQKGRFCAACNKTVVDFSDMTDQQLVAFFSRKKENTCGRFHPHQLQREIAVSASFVPWVKPFFPLAVFALTLLVGACETENKVLGEPLHREVLLHKKPSDASGNPAVPGYQSLAPDDNQLSNKKEKEVQVVTKKDKTPHPAFIPVDTMQLPRTDTISSPEQTTDSLRKPLLHPRKEALIMGMVLYTHRKAVAEKNKKEVVMKEKK